MPTTHTWQGDAVAVAQESRATPANVGTADVFTLTCGGVSVSYTAESGDGVAEVTAGLTTAWNASTAPQLTEVTATDKTTYVELLCDAAGVEFTATGSTTDGDGSDDQTLTISTATAVAGPSVWAAANFDSATLPVTGDTVVLEDSDVDILYGLDQSSVTLAVLRIRQSYTGTVGLPRTAAASAHVSGTSAYVEYRDTYLRISATSLEIGEGDGSGSGRLKIDVGANQTTANIHNSGAPAEQNHAPIIWKGTNASNAMSVTKGDIEVAPFAGETATLATLRVGYKSNRTDDSEVSLGSGATLTTIEQSGGKLHIRSNLTTLRQTAGAASIYEAATLTTLNLYGGTCYYQSSGTLTTANVAGILDFRRDMRARTVTNCELYGGAAIHDPHKTVTWTNGVDCHLCSPTEATLNIGTHLRLTVGAVA